MNKSSLVFCLIVPPNLPNDFKFNEDLSLSDNEIIFLKKYLMLNLIENLSTNTTEDRLHLRILLQENLLENYNDVLETLSSKKLDIQFCTNREKLLEESKLYSKIFLIQSDVMGVSAKDIINTEKLISSDDNVLVISKSFDDEVCFIASNSFDDQLFNKIIESKINYENILSAIAPDKFFIHILNEHFRVNNFSNFKLLYKKLSTKESLEYCNQKMHENFTTLFIEYRDYIK